MAKDEIVDVEAEAKPTSDNIFTGLVVFTTVALVVGFIFIEIAWKNNYGRGLFGG